MAKKKIVRRLPVSCEKYDPANWTFNGHKLTDFTIEELQRLLAYFLDTTTTAQEFAEDLQLILKNGKDALLDQLENEIEKNTSEEFKRKYKKG